jgi:lipopolysaccharide/colanic/teichoic acid biosynthesis glycosyltransferase
MSLASSCGGTRELGAYRYVNRVGEKAERLSAGCRLFLYPTLKDDPRDAEQGGIDDILNSVGKRGNSILDHITDVEQKLAQALDVETAVVSDEEFNCDDESFGFGYDDDDDDDEDISTPSAPATSSTSTFGSQAERADGGVATIAPTATRPRTRLSTQGGLQQAQETAASRSLPVVMEPLENLFLFPHPTWKRAIDLLGAVFGLVVLSPVLLTVAALIKITSPGPAMFKQLREGHGGKLFTIYKFRTMRVGADAEKATLQAQSEQDGPAFKMTHDPRITPIGSFLRKTCLDELPQLWNVVKGDMTLVGPRPLDYRESEKIARWGRRRMHVMPGLTCIWQVHGKSKVSFNEWMRMDIRYSQRVNFHADFTLVLETLKQVILRKASQ